MIHPHAFRSHFFHHTLLYLYPCKESLEARSWPHTRTQTRIIFYVQCILCTMSANRPKGEPPENLQPKVKYCKHVGINTGREGLGYRVLFRNIEGRMGSTRRGSDGNLWLSTDTNRLTYSPHADRTSKDIFDLRIAFLFYRTSISKALAVKSDFIKFIQPSNRILERSTNYPQFTLKRSGRNERRT